jgi:ABC-type antimicrobial peptide transport system permease subunit
MGEVFRRGFLLSGIGVGVGCVAALAATPGLRPFLTGVPARDPLTYAVVLAGFGLVALLACLPPALRAARIDPMVALQSG